MRLRESGDPLYMRVADELRKEILSGRFDAGGKMPPEAELASGFGVSRATVREAVSILVREGLIKKSQGRPTALVQPTMYVGEGMERLRSFSEAMEVCGKRPGTSWLKFSWEDADEELACIFRISKGSRIGVIARVRTADEEPATYSVDKVPAATLGEDVDPEVFRGSLFQYLRGRGVQLGYSETSVKSVVSTPEINELLNLPSTVAMLLVEETYFDVDNRPVIWCRNYHRSDRFQFRLIRK